MAPSFDGLLERGFQCLFCQKDIGRKPCSASQAYSVNHDVCPWCTMGILGMDEASRDDHLRTCEKDCKRNDVFLRHDAQFAERMAAGKLAPSKKKR